MKNKLYALLPLLFVLMTSCVQNEKPQQSTTELEQTLNTFLDDWHRAAAKADYEGYFGKIAEDGIYIGTDVTEHWTKTEFEGFSKPYFDRGKAWDFTAKERNLFVSKEGNIVWFDEVLDTWMGDCRTSGVLENTKEGWKIKHYQLSVTVPNEKIQQFIDLIDG
ncbi:nuclear transport factor 2 family protein [Limibacter armeniacum]|uniref:nuclear transport factor 2 family protein n=1 Tax=Limibacter armeniacum TaxID=466084 RepID=UPI002FE53FA0